MTRQRCRARSRSAGCWRWPSEIQRRGCRVAMSAMRVERRQLAALLTVERGMQVLRAFKSDRCPADQRRTGASHGPVEGDRVATDEHAAATRATCGTRQRSRQFELAAASAGRWATPSSRAASCCATAQPFMQSLADRLGVSVALAIGDGLRHALRRLPREPSRRDAAPRRPARCCRWARRRSATPTSGRYPPASSARLIKELRRDAGLASRGARAAASARASRSWTKDRHCAACSADSSATPTASRCRSSSDANAWSWASAAARPRCSPISRPSASASRRC